MNIGKFKEIVNTWENSEENFKSFRLWAENCYFLYEKNYNLEMAETQALAAMSNEIDKMDYDWTSINYDNVVMTYSELGWALDEKIREAKIFYDEWGCSCYGISFPEIYEKIKVVEDNVEFAYAILAVTKNVSLYCSLYKVLIKRLYKGLREYGLFPIIDMIESEEKKKVFVAMSFDDSMLKARKSIISAIEDCGYTSMLIDIKEHNNQIVPEIYKEINSSEFVVADLTGQRGGVYYEAGYAVAKNKELILSCKKGENPHFDVAQINTIFWENEQDLKERLIKRIEATTREKE